jgi:hypothetical protein
MDRPLLYLDTLVKEMCNELMTQLPQLGPLRFKLCDRGCFVNGCR